MQFSALKSRLDTVLAEYSTALSNVDTTNFWSDTEKSHYLNLAYREFCIRTRITTKHEYLRVTDEGNTYPLPEDIEEIISVQYEGKPLDQKSVKYLESVYSGTSHFQHIKGLGRKFEHSWRERTGKPRHWYMENGAIHCFPRLTPDLNGMPPSARNYYYGSVVDGDMSIRFASRFPTYNKSLVDIYINGILQNPQDYTLADWVDGLGIVRTVANFVGRFEYDADVVAVVQNTALIASRYSKTLTSDTAVVYFNNVVASSPVYRVAVNGDVAEPNTYSANLNGTTLSITFMQPGYPSGTIIDVTVYDVQEPIDDDNSENLIANRKLTIDYIYIPTDMADGTDVPVIPPAFHDAIWQYAAYLALTREGQQTQDFQKAAVYKDMFEANVARAIRLVQPPVDVDYAVNMPFYV
jgi:hypothetical protein